MSNIKITELGLAPSIANADNLVIVHEGATEKTTAKSLFDAAIDVGGLATQKYVDDSITNLIDGAKDTLDTLKEITIAINEDPDFYTHISATIGTKLNTADFTSTANTWLGDKTTNALIEGSTNLYFTTSRARNAIGAGTGISYNSSTGVVSSSITQYTDALAQSAARKAISTYGSNLSYNETSGVISASDYAIYKSILIQPDSGVDYPTDDDQVVTKGYVDSQINATTISSTDDLPQGTINKYFSNELATTAARYALGAGTGIDYDSTTGVITNTDGLSTAFPILNGNRRVEGEEITFGGGDIPTIESVAGGTKITVDRNGNISITLATVAFSGSYSDLVGTPDILQMFKDSIDYNDLKNKPNLELAPVAYSGSFADLTAVPTTTDIEEGSNLYWTMARGIEMFDDRLSNVDTTSLAEGDNKYYTDARARASISAGNGISYDSSTGTISTGFPRLPNYATDGLANVALGNSPQMGHIYFNTTELKIKFYNGTAWMAIG